MNGAKGPTTKIHHVTDNVVEAHEGILSTEIAPRFSYAVESPWVMSYCWRTQQCRNWCLAHAFLYGTGAWSILGSNIGRTALT